MLGVSRKRFIKDLSGNNDSKERLGGTISSSLYAMMQGVQILRVHDVNEVNQSLKVFKSLKFLSESIDGSIKNTIVKILLSPELRVCSIKQKHSDLIK